MVPPLVMDSRMGKRPSLSKAQVRNPSPICLRQLVQPTLEDRAFDLARVGKKIATVTSTQAMVTRSSIRLKALVDLVRGDCM